MSSRVTRYAQSTAKWIAAGSPVRSDTEVRQLLTICQACEWYDGSNCRKCGCRVNLGGGWGNKIRRATEHCPLNKWNTTPSSPPSTPVLQELPVLKETGTITRDGVEYRIVGTIGSPVQRRK